MQRARLALARPFLGAATGSTRVGPLFGVVGFTVALGVQRAGFVTIRFTAATGPIQIRSRPTLKRSTNVA